MPVESHDIPKVYRIQLLISQFPILADEIRERMRQELFRRGVISRERFEAEVRDKAILSQRREGILNPYVEETRETWERRLSAIRDALTDFYFAYNLPQHAVETLIEEVVGRRQPEGDFVLTYNPEMAPWALLFQQAEAYEALPPEEYARVEHHLREIVVVLIKAMISDQLAFVRVAKEYLTIADLKWIRNQRIGQGKIGGKAAGMVLAAKVLQRALLSQGDSHQAIQLVVPESYFVGGDVFYDFLANNDLGYYVNQKYKPIDQIENEYPELQAAHMRGKLPDYVVDRLRDILADVQNKPLIVRSSSLLEDNFDTSFAGKYDSVFCPNQGTPEENLENLERAILRVYASVYKPDALLYRKQTGLLDYDERMAVLIQVVQGERYAKYYFPAIAGMAYSRNPFIWNPKLRREDGFARLVVGMGTRAVERVGEDYPRMVALSHPQLRPESGAQQIRYYSQYFMDVINLERNCFETLRIDEVLRGDYPPLRFMAALDRGDYIGPMFVRDPSLDPRSLVMTFDGLLSNTPFVPQMKSTLKALEFAYGRPVDIEFTIALGHEYPRPSVELHLLQCRPAGGHELAEAVQVPTNVPENAIIFGTEKLVPTGRVRDIAYIVYVDPAAYAQLANVSEKLQIARVIGHINQRLEGTRFILMGPGRWGSSNPDLGVKVGYADIYNTRALVEIGLAQGKNRPTLSYGTHFFQDLVESHIYPLAIYPGEPGNPFRKGFFDAALNALPFLLPDDARYADTVKVIDVGAVTGGRVLQMDMSGEQAKALAYLTHKS
ncbi:MAG TPA: PEP/pyruvate-binding domain-containing protein [Anaerolineae bacterium]